ncbi:MAG: class I SAM-dependent methyltransferase [Kiritimatiellae bacterium]|nr:class I SAM-dependent methyltransferase [Kiritimatiellia bacterium]
MVQAYKRYVTKSSLVLEIGASRPERTRELCRYCKSLTGLELMPERTPSDFENVKYVTGDWRQLSSIITPGNIDIVVASHVIEHVPDDLKALDELYKVLTSDGVALINTPNRQRFTRRIIEAFTGKRKFPYWKIKGNT